MQGRIVKGVGGFYEVLSNGVIYTCRARGRFRKAGASPLTPLIGDNVEFTPNNGEELGSVEGILTRKNALRRPAMANVDQLLLVTSAKDPEPDLMMVDKLLLYARSVDVDVVMVINKCDLAPPEAVEAIAHQYHSAVKAVLSVSAERKIGLQSLKENMQGRCSCLAGQSGVGKSSLINALFPQFELATGEVSNRTSHGKHTTRHAQLLILDGGGEVADTPGFSLMEMDSLEPRLLPALYPEFAPYQGECRFNGCFHVSEPGCAVKEAVTEGAIAKERWQRYTELLKELREMWRTRYD